jgi:FkbH-like protein
MEINLTLGSILYNLKSNPAAYLKAARQIKAHTFEELRAVNIAFLSTFTSEILQPYLVVESAARGLLLNPYFAPFNQVAQQVLDEASFLYESEPEVVVLATRIEEIAPNLVHRYLTLSATEIENELAKIEKEIHQLIEGVRHFTTATIVVFNFANPMFLAAGFADPLLNPSQVSVIQHANERLAAICRQSIGVYVFDYARMVSEFGIQRWYDRKLWYLGRIPFGAHAQRETGKQLARFLRALIFPPSKCLVLDLDNTLWGRVVGENGLGGIALGENYPGNIYKDFHRLVLSLRDRGVLLAIASKNNERDGLEVFEKHPDSLLKVEDFAAIQIHWNDKASSLVAIAKALNIGTDALVFFDDNPVEREWVRMQIPEVTVIEVPKNALNYAQALIESGAFDQINLLIEDRRRSELYQKELQRKELQSETISLDDFLQQLYMTVKIGDVNSDTLPRVSQLLAKTNQFNLTTRRHTSSDIQALIESGAVALWLRVTDRFGDNGLVGVTIAVPSELGEWKIDTFLLSCRVLGRRVETVLLGILSRIIRERGGQLLVGEYLPTPKNGPAAQFYRTHDFEPIDNKGNFWKWNLSLGEIPFPEFVKVRLMNGIDIS